MKTCSLSGFGGGYEEMCQRMLWRGVAYLAERKPPFEMWAGAKSYTNIYGVVSTEGADLKGLEDFIMRDGEDVTGAMHHCVMGHLAYIHKNGTEQWLAELERKRPATDFFDYVWDGK